MSHQACLEFIRNRIKVIVSSEKTFKEAFDEIGKLRKSIENTANQLKGNRLLNDGISSELVNTIMPILDLTEKNIIETQSKHPLPLRRIRY